jgi:hypothetical protein
VSAPRIKIGNLESGRNRVAEHDLLRRQNAVGILSPEAVGGKVSAGKLLYTTLHGSPRQITADDLAQFRAKAASLGTRYRAGVTIADLVNGSHPEDLKRAREQVQWSSPARLRSGTVDFVTNASRESKATRHYVKIIFGDYGAALARPGTPLQAAAWLVSDGHLKYDCDCGRHVFWYRFIATSIGANAARGESGFPKVRNPQLAGLGCKHVLRTVTDLRSSMLVRKRLADMIAADRAHLDKPGRSKPKTIRVTQAEADAITAGRVRRIAVKPQQRGVTMPTVASQANIHAAIAAFSGKSDANSLAISRGLAALLQTHRTAA